MKQFLLMICFLSFSSSSDAADSYNIYLVRHAEKLTDSNNPALTVCGNKRAKQLANILSKANVNAIYSTNYLRTMQTAQPFAKQQNMAIKNYNPKDLEQFALHLTQKQENALIVGHSNTTPLLVELLTEQKVALLTEQNFQYLYQVQFTNENVVLTILQQPLNCIVSPTDEK